MTDCGRAEPVSVEDEVDPAAGTEYLPEDHAIRYVAYRRAHDEDPPERDSAYETQPFEEWARSKCANLGHQRVTEVVESRFESDQSAGFSWGRLRDAEESEDDSDGDDTDENDDADYVKLAVKVEIGTMCDRDGSIISEPTIEFEALRELTPESVTATVHFAGQTHTATFPVVVEETEGQML